MKRLVIAVVIALATLVPATPATGAKDPFVGSWEAVNPNHGGLVHIRVGGGNHRIVVTAPIGTVCFVNLGRYVRATVVGFGDFNEDGDLTMDGAAHCNSTGRGGGGRIDVGALTITLRDNGNDT
ncbi:MAG: hypothetical protein ACR2PK_06450, partial [Acidimicrobiales bacterium]